MMLKTAQDVHPVVKSYNQKRQEGGATNTKIYVDEITQ